MTDRFLTDFELMVMLAVLRVRDEAYGEGEGRSKKQAEQAAAWVAYSRLQESGDAGTP